MFETGMREDVLQIARPGTHWLSTGWDGGESVADAVHSISVPSGWDCDDLETYVEKRLASAGFDRGGGPVLLTGVDTRHVRGARLGPVEVYATAGVSNPAALPMEVGVESTAEATTDETYRAGTVNLIVGTTKSLTEGALANLVAVATEAKAATLLAETGFPGTTTDAVVVACDPDDSDDPVEFSGSATAVGSAARACVREAVRASLESRYTAEPERPESVADAKYGVVTDTRAEVFEPGSS